MPGPAVKGSLCSDRLSRQLRRHWKHRPGALHWLAVAPIGRRTDLGTIQVRHVGALRASMPPGALA